MVVALSVLLLPTIVLAEAQEASSALRGDQRHTLLMSCDLPPDPTPWFEEQVMVINEEALPAGVRVKGNGSILTITNSSSQPLYILGQVFTETPPDVLGLQPPDLPDGALALYKLMDSQVFEWDPDNTVNGVVPSWSWTQRNGAGWRAVWLKAEGGAVHGHWGTVASLEDRNRIEDHRPDDVSLPAPQQTSLALLYGEAPLDLALTITYQLNPAYSPTSVQDRRDWAGCGNIGLQLLLGVAVLWIGGPLVGLALLVVTVKLLRVGFRRRKEPAIQRRFAILVGVGLLGGVAWYISGLPREARWELAHSAWISQVTWPDGREGPNTVYRDNLIATVDLPGGYRVERWQGAVLFVRSFIKPDLLAAVRFNAPARPVDQAYQEASALLQRYGFGEADQARLDAWYAQKLNSPSEAASYLAERVEEIETGIMIITLSVSSRANDDGATSGMGFQWME